MRVFEHFNTDGPKCLVCKTNADKPCTLVPVAGTQEGFNVRAEPVHMDCLDVWFYPDQWALFQKVSQ